MSELLNYALIVLYLATCTYILVTSYLRSVLFFYRIVIQNEALMNLLICISYIVAGQLAVVSVCALNNALLENFVNKDVLDAVTNFHIFILTSSSILGIVPMINWTNLSEKEIFSRCLLKIPLPLFISGIFSRLSLNIMKTLCNTQTIFYREFLSDEKMLIFWCVAIVNLLIVCAVFKEVTVLSKKIDDIDREKCDFKENN